MMTILVFSIVILTLFDNCFGVEFVIPKIEGFKGEGNFIYAHDLCFRREVTLPMPQSDEDNKILSDFLEQQKIYNIWLAANDNGEEGKYRWITTGQTVENLFWHQNQPDDTYRKQNCVQFNKYETTWALGRPWSANTSSSVKRDSFCQSQPLRILMSMEDS